MSNVSPVIWFFKNFSKWILFFLFTVWIFILGILVGRETTPVKIDNKDLQKELAELKKADMEKQVDRIRVESEKIYDDQELGFYEELKDSAETQPDVDLEQIRQKRAETVDVKTPKADKKEVEEEGKPAKQPVMESSPKPEPPPRSPKLNAETAKMSIQVASFKDPEAAETKANELKQKGYEAYVSKGEIPNKGTWYRVRIGYFNERAQAVTTLEKLKKHRISCFMTNIEGD